MTVDAPVVREPFRLGINYWPARTAMQSGNATAEPLAISQSINGRGSNSAWNGQ